MKLRKVRFNDWEILLNWRNDPSTRENSLIKNEISPETHKLWFNDSLMNNRRNIYILEENKLPIGTIRCDILSKDKYQSPYQMYPGTGQLRTNFQKGEDSGWSHGSYDIWNKQLIVKGFTISDGDDGGGALYFHNNKAHDKLYIQTNDINIAKEKTNKFFFKLLMDAMEREIKKTL